MSLGDVGNGTNAPDPLMTVVAEGAVCWTTLPNTCSVGSPDSRRQMEIGKTEGERSHFSVKPRLANGTYFLGNTIFWLDRQPWRADDDSADSYFSLKRTTL